MSFYPASRFREGLVIFCSTREFVFMTGLFINTLYLGLGGFIGSVGRYWTQFWVGRLFGNHLPLGTLAVNITGSFLIGFLMVFLARPGLSHPGFRLFFVVGLMGGFTTYSSFSYDNLKLIQEGRFGEALLYSALTFFPGMFLVWAGTLVGRGFLRGMFE